MIEIGGPAVEWCRIGRELLEVFGQGYGIMCNLTFSFLYLIHVSFIMFSVHVLRTFYA